MRGTLEAGFAEQAAELEYQRLPVVWIINMMFMLYDYGKDAMVTVSSPRGNTAGPFTVAVKFDGTNNFVCRHSGRADLSILLHSSCRILQVCPP